MLQNQKQLNYDNMVMWKDNFPYAYVVFSSKSDLRATWVCNMKNCSELQQQSDVCYVCLYSAGHVNFKDLPPDKFFNCFLNAHLFVVRLHQYGWRIRFEGQC